MFDIHPIRYGIMILLSALALLCLLGTFASAAFALVNLQNWHVYILPYLVTVVLACTFTGMVYVARDVGR